MRGLKIVKKISKVLDVVIAQRSVLNKLQEQKDEEHEKHLKESATYNNAIEELTKTNELKVDTLEKTITLLEENIRKGHEEQIEKFSKITKEYEKRIYEYT